MSVVKFQSVTPILQVENLQRALEFYTTVLGFKIAWTWGTPANRGSVCRDDVELMLEEKALGEAPRITHVYMRVNEIDAYYQAICAAGARVKVLLADRPYGMRDARVVDVDGNELGFGTELP